MIDCKVCYDKYNSKNKKITCNFCLKDACTTCYKKHILGSDTRASCVSCLKTFSHKFLSENFSKSFLNEQYKKKLEKLAIASQMSLLPETQKIIRKENKLESIAMEKNELKKELYTIYEKLRNLGTKEYIIRNNSNYDVDTDTVLENPVNKIVINGYCPKDNCNGFITDRWNCGICDTKVCDKCLEIVSDNEHLCNKDILENVNEMRSISKKCPNCSVQISRISGCPHMFCTECKVFFDWTNMAVIEKRGNVSNPHYDEWILQKNNGKQCMNLHIELQNIFKQCEYLEQITSFIYTATRPLRMDYKTALELVFEREALVLRKKFLRSEIDTEQFGILLQRLYKKNEKDLEICDIRIAFANISTDIISGYINKYKDLRNINADLLDTNESLKVDLFNEMTKKIREYFNYFDNEITKVCYRYNCTLDINQYYLQSSLPFIPDSNDGFYNFYSKKELEIRKINQNSLNREFIGIRS
jgi:hypothetical protein